MDVFVSFHGKKIYHNRSCSCLSKLPEESIIPESEYILLRLGYKPCKRCMRGLDSLQSKEADAVSKMCKKFNIRYSLTSDSILLNTDIGHWKLQQGRSGYTVYHGNEFPQTWVPQQLTKDRYHIQSDLHFKDRQDISEVINYIYEHDKFRMNELESINNLPQQTKAQKRTYNKMKKKKDSWCSAKTLQKLDKLKYD